MVQIQNTTLGNIAFWTKVERITMTKFKTLWWTNNTAQYPGHVTAQSLFQPHPQQTYSSHNQLVSPPPADVFVTLPACVTPQADVFVPLPACVTPQADVFVPLPACFTPPSRRIRPITSLFHPQQTYSSHYQLSTLPSNNCASKFETLTSPKRVFICYTKFQAQHE